MGKVIEIRGVRIGEGLPKIIVPIVGRTKEEILEAAASFAGVPYDIVEWRADWFEDLGEEKKVVETLRAWGSEGLEGEKRAGDRRPLPWTCPSCPSST